MFLQLACVDNRKKKIQESILRFQTINWGAKIKSFDEKQFGIRWGYEHTKFIEKENEIERKVECH
jgi:hypothetical protein